MEYVARENRITVAYEEMAPSPDISVNDYRIFATRTFKIKWVDRWVFMLQILGYTEYRSTTRGGAWWQIYYLPHPYEYTLFKGRLVAVNISSIKGFPDTGLVEAPISTSMAEYTDAIVTVDYETPAYDITRVPFVTESLEPVAEFITLNSQGIFWDNGGVTPIDDAEAPALMLRMFDWVYTIHQLAMIPAELMLYNGYVNNGPVYSRSLDMWFAAETLLLGNPVMTREYTSLGRTHWTVTIRMTAREGGWNMFPRPSTGGFAPHYMSFAPIYNAVGNRIRPYPYTNFNNIVI